MDQQAAFARFQAYCPPDEDPTLDHEQVVALIEEAVTVDADGNPPSSADWTETYSVLGVWRAIAEGWQAKAAAAVGRFDFATDGQSFQRSQVVDHCEAMADRYMAKANVSVSTTSRSAS